MSANLRNIKFSCYYILCGLFHRAKISFVQWYSTSTKIRFAKILLSVFSRRKNLFDWHCRYFQIIFQKLKCQQNVSSSKKIFYTILNLIFHPQSIKQELTWNFFAGYILHFKDRDEIFRKSFQKNYFPPEVDLSFNILCR